ncbi:MAG: prolipoprotein diacylglyceryl transferase [Clostridia bacterium]|nr:prolipoprotein diacylglyceryl transferase [Clostridia bacterium]
MENVVKFPGLGLSFNINRVAIPKSIIGIDIYWYAVIITLGIVLAYLYCIRRGSKEGIDKEIFTDILLWGIPSAIIGARLYYVIFRWQNYVNNPMKIFALRDGGLAIYGAIIFSVVTVFIYLKSKKISPYKIFDICVIGLLIGQATGRWGNFFNQEAFGSNTTLKWGMISEETISYLSSLKLKGYDVDPLMPVHPTFLYESLWNIIGIIILHNYSKKKKFDSEIFILYIIWYGLGRVFIEGLRTDSLYFFNIRVSQLVGLISIIVGVVFYIIMYKKRVKNEK